MKRSLKIFLFVALVSLVIVGVAGAQSSGLTLKLSRDWGYGGFNNDIEGLFSMHVTGPADLARVEYFIDSTKIGELTQAPFTLQFTTDDYPLGIHTLSAVGYSATGQAYTSNQLSANFVPKQNAMKFILPVLGIVLAAVLLSALGPIFISRGKRKNPLPLGTERNYGVGGGAICPKCHRPFKLPLFTMHLGFSNLAACPNCGKWSLVQRTSIDKLRQAERDELQMAGPSSTGSDKPDEATIKKDLDDSKFQD